MKKKLLFFALLFVLLLFVVWFASPLPDGLEFAAEKLGFASMAIERPACFSSYCLLSGVAGGLLCFGFFWLLSKFT